MICLLQGGCCSSSKPDTSPGAHPQSRGLARGPGGGGGVAPWASQLFLHRPTSAHSVGNRTPQHSTNSPSALRTKRAWFSASATSHLPPTASQQLSLRKAPHPHAGVGHAAQLFDSLQGATCPTPRRAPPGCRHCAGCWNGAGGSSCRLHPWQIPGQRGRQMVKHCSGGGPDNKTVFRE